RHSRESDVVARVGGDEFVLLLWNCSEADAQAKAQAIETAIGRMTPIDAGTALQVGASCGVAMLLPLDRPQDLLDRADRAMYPRNLGRGGLRGAIDNSLVAGARDLPPPPQCATFAICRRRAICRVALQENCHGKPPCPDCSSRFGAVASGRPERLSE